MIIPELVHTYIHNEQHQSLSPPPQQVCGHDLYYFVCTHSELLVFHLTHTTSGAKVAGSTRVRMSVLDRC